MRRIVLDSGPVSVGCNDPSLPEAMAFKIWTSKLLNMGVAIHLPELADYEVRRKLLHLNARPSLRRLDALGLRFDYAQITTPVMRKAAELWADARRRGRPTSGPRSLDADSILAAQAILLAGPEDRVTVATENVGHIGQFVDARPWQSIA